MRVVELQATLHRLEEELLEINTNTIQLQVEFTEMVEMRETIDYVQAVLDEVYSTSCLSTLSPFCLFY